MYALSLRISDFAFARSAGGGGGAGDAIVKANTDLFHPPTEEEIRERDLSQDAAIALSVATLILVGADILWALLGLTILGEFPWAILAFLVADLGLVWSSRSPSLRNRVLTIGRGVAGIAWFTVAVIVFGDPVAFPVGQGVLLLSILVLILGRGGEGENRYGDRRSGHIGGVDLFAGVRSEANRDQRS